MSDIILNPKTIKLLAVEIIRVCNGYWSREMSENEAKHIINYWSKHENYKLFKGKELNPTIIKTIGAKRVRLINKFLEGVQFSF